MIGSNVVPPDGVDLLKLTTGWTWVYLNELLTRIEAGKNFRCEERPPAQSEYGIVKISAVTWGTYDENESKTITDNERVNLDHIIKPGDFLFSRANTIELIGACLIVHQTQRKLLLSDKILRFSFAGGFRNWINWILKSRLGRLQIEALSTGNQESMRNIGQKQIGRICVPVPPLNERHRIVAKIEELFSELDNGIEALTTARQQIAVYRLTLLDHAVSGSLLVSRGLCKTPFDRSAWKPLSEIVSELGQGWSPRCLNRPSSGNDVWAVITTTAIQHGSFQDGENKELPAQLQPRPHLTITVGDILVTRAGPRKRVGVVCLVRKCRPRLMLCDKAYRLQVRTDRVLPEWLEFVLNSPRVLQEIEELKTGISDSGVNLTQDRFLALNVPIPSLEQQEQTVKILETAMSQVANMENQVETTLLQAVALRQSILKQAFSGQLVAHDPTDEPASVLLEHIRAERKNAVTKEPRRRVKKNTNGKEDAA
jgi:type I restriction enzyme, S subunit